MENYEKFIIDHNFRNNSTNKKARELPKITYPDILDILDETASSLKYISLFVKFKLRQPIIIHFDDKEYNLHLSEYFGLEEILKVLQEKCSNISTLKLGKLQENHVKYVKELLKTNANLSVFKNTKDSDICGDCIRNNQTFCNHTSQIQTILSCLPDTVEQLKICSHKICTTNICKLLQQKPNIRKLHLTFSTFCNTIMRTLKMNKNLKSLCLVSTGGSILYSKNATIRGSGSILHLEDLEDISNLTLLEKLHLEGFPVWSKTILKIVQSCTELRHFKLGVRSLSEEALEAIFSLPHLQTLELKELRTLPNITLKTNLLELHTLKLNFLSECIFKFDSLCKSLKYMPFLRRLQVEEISHNFCRIERFSQITSTLLARNYDIIVQTKELANDVSQIKIQKINSDEKKTFSINLSAECLDFINVTKISERYPDCNVLVKKNKDCQVARSHEYIDAYREMYFDIRLDVDVNFDDTEKCSTFITKTLSKWVDDNIKILPLIFRIACFFVYIYFMTVVLNIHFYSI